MSDLDASASFYGRYLDAAVVEESPEAVVLDVVTALLELRLDRTAADTSWTESERTRGFRHIGFKVADVDEMVRRLHAGGVTFRSRAQEVTSAGVRIAFFFDPDGTLLEVVERHLAYVVVHDQSAVALERLMPVPERPRFDHIGHTVSDTARSVALYRDLDFAHLGSVPLDDADGFRIDFLRSGETVLELFSYHSPTYRPVRHEITRGFTAAEIDGQCDDFPSVAALETDRQVVLDPDGLPLVFSDN
ncbi:catechol 2,3-dioxygenase-like lactoylglutathione lyase family enzyme [Microbacterium phyllosphaerae]|nr:catechol 2,3-dioxygenase-like lactoylglutathione lyase family enzyme [Microbacterium phyllosphaerae]